MGSRIRVFLYSLMIVSLALVSAISVIPARADDGADWSNGRGGRHRARGPRQARRAIHDADTRYARRVPRTDR